MVSIGEDPRDREEIPEFRGEWMNQRMRRQTMPSTLPNALRPWYSESSEPPPDDPDTGDNGTTKTVGDKGIRETVVD